MEKSIELTDVSMCFTDASKKKIEALKDVSISFYSGEKTALIGANGAGKTTLFRIISGIIKPASGKVLIYGKDSSVFGDENKRTIGLLSSDINLYERLTPREVLRFTGRMFEMTEDRIDERMSFFSENLSLDKILDRLCCGLSTGERQKVLISRAMFCDPKIIILDEASNGLDILARQHIINLIKNMKDKTVIYSTHNMDEVEKIATRAVFLDKGRIIDDVKYDGSFDITDRFLKKLNSV